MQLHERKNQPIWDLPVENMSPNYPPNWRAVPLTTFYLPIYLPFHPLPLLQPYLLLIPQLRNPPLPTNSVQWQLHLPSPLQWQPPAPLPLSLHSRRLGPMLPLPLDPWTWTPTAKWSARFATNLFSLGWWQTMPSTSMWPVILGWSAPSVRVNL